MAKRRLKIEPEASPEQGETIRLTIDSRPPDTSGQLC